MRAKTARSRFSSAARRRAIVSGAEWRLATETSPSCAMALPFSRLVSTRALLLRQRRAEGFEEFAIHRIVLRVVFGVPLHAERETRRLGNADRFDGAVIGHALDDDAFAGLEDTLAVQRIDPNGFGSQQLRKDASRRQTYLVAVGKNHLHIGVEFAVRQTRRAVIDAAGQFADFRMQRAAIGDVHLLKAAADAEQRHASRDA